MKDASNIRTNFPMFSIGRNSDSVSKNQEVSEEDSVRHYIRSKADRPSKSDMTLLQKVTVTYFVMSADELFAKDDSNLKAQVDRMIHFNVVSYFSKIMREGGGADQLCLV